jgi:hypothetical protein
MAYAPAGFLPLSHLCTYSLIVSPSHLFIMDPSDSPFTNLDLWCNWTGEPNDPVEVVVSVEVRDTEATPALISTLTSTVTSRSGAPLTMISLS